MLAIALQFEAELQPAVAFRFGALRFERTGSTVGTFVHAALGEIAISGLVGLVFEIDHTVLRRTNEFIRVWIIGKVGGLETQFFHYFELAGGC